MIKVVFKGPLRKSVGFRDLEVEDGDLENILRKISEELGVNFKIEGDKIYMRANVDGMVAKFMISIFYGGKNVITEKIRNFEGGVLDIITPMGGG